MGLTGAARTSAVQQGDAGEACHVEFRKWQQGLERQAGKVTGSKGMARQGRLGEGGW